MFKAGERVWHSRMGWGELLDNMPNDDYPLLFRPDAKLGSELVTFEGYEVADDLFPIIFYKEQTLDMSKPEPEIGTWGYFWDEEFHKSAHLAQLTKIVDAVYRYWDLDGGESKHFSPDIPPHIKELMNGTNQPNP